MEEGGGHHLVVFPGDLALSCARLLPLIIITELKIVAPLAAAALFRRAALRLIGIAHIELKSAEAGCILSARGVRLRMQCPGSNRGVCKSSKQLIAELQT